MPEKVSVIGVGTNERFDTSTLRFGYQSPVTPSSVYDYDMNSRTRTLRKQREVLGGFDRDDYVASRFEASKREAT